MKITILNDNIASGICNAAHGLSWMIEADKKILFDTGPSDIIIKNAETLGMSLTDVFQIVLSHGHWDHANGLQYLNGGKLLAHPEIYRKRFNRSHGIGIDISQEQIEKKYEVTYSKDPLKISNEIYFLGEIERVHDWDSGHEDFKLENGEDDSVPDDTGIVAHTNQGLVVISGCAHSGITNITEQARRLFPDKPVISVMGGFHLKPGDKRIQPTIEYFKSLNLKSLYPSHCTAPEVIAEMRESLPVKFVRSGNIFRF
ncbi:MAG: MBL fold metallo-hydrolase [Salinivirgaceae bacterium]|nr:MAG: MBL fold metallo-hydrolase [Salinivirgaceae bacterium]